MIRMVNVVKNYDTKQRVLDCVNMHVKEGSIYGLIGVNGSGKTTLIKHITGILKQNSGEVKVAGEDIYENNKVKEQIAYIPDDLFYYHGYSLRDMANNYAKIYATWSWDKYEKLLNEFKINEKEKLNSFSKGMLKQAFFVMALSINSKILVLDEPVDGLDPIIRKKVWSAVMEEVADRKLTVLISSHNLREMEGVCDSIGIMKDGQIKIEREIDSLKSGIHKIQVAFKKDLFNPFAGLNIIHEDHRGSVSMLIVRDKTEKIEQIINEHDPLIFDILPLTLEEIFIYELGGEKDE